VYGANVLYHPINKKAYSVYWDKTMRLGGSSEVSNSTMFNKFIKMNMMIDYIANNTGDNQQTKQLTFVILCAEAADDTAAGLSVDLSFHARTFFTDA